MSNTQDIIDWLIVDGRLMGDGPRIVAAYAERLQAAGVPVDRVNMAQRYANPLLVAWGLVWTPDGTSDYSVPRGMLNSEAYKGSPFEYIQTHRVTLRRKLDDVDPEKDHPTYVERARDGATEILAFVLDYSDGSTHSCSFYTSEPGGFTDEQAKIIEDTRHALACALEPPAMRSSTASLLRTYLGKGPGASVFGGTSQRGEHTEREAVVMISDLRGFTAMSDDWPVGDVLMALDEYFEVVVDAVQMHGGDVLKFMGDGVLSVFVVQDDMPRQMACENAIAAAKEALAALDARNRTREARGAPSLAMGMGLDVGSVIYGNIGSPDRLDFTVLGGAVNVASRVQDMCKVLGAPILMTANVASQSSGDHTSLGYHSVRGVSANVEILSGT